MPQAFLSHSSKDKRIVHRILDALKKSLVKALIYDREIAGGEGLLEAVTAGLSQSQYCLVFLSTNYLASSWCVDELQWAYSLYQKGELRLLPVLLDERGQLGLEHLPAARQPFVDLLLRQIKYVQFDRYDEEKSIAAVLKEFWANESVQFDPIKIETIDGVMVQLIRYGLNTKALPSNFLQGWHLDIEEFIATDKADGKPIQMVLPVAFSGVAINWLITYLTIPFKNRRTVFVYNQNTQDYVCVFSLPHDQMLGKTLKAR